MPLKADPRDWDRLFRPNAPRRGGPLRALANTLILCTVLAILGVGGVLAARQIDVARQAAAETAVVQATFVAETLLGYTATTVSRTAEAAVAATAQAAAVTPTTVVETILGRSVVLNGGNLRNEPVVLPETVIGQICADDQVEILEERTVADGTLWYRVRVTAAPIACTPQRVSLGSSGWASSTLLAPPTP
jgi:hypothetical protein